MSFSNSTFARGLSEHMRLTGMDVETLAKRSGVSMFSIRDYLGEKSEPRLGTAYALADALGCTPNDLCCWPEKASA